MRDKNELKKFKKMMKRKPSPSEQAFAHRLSARGIEFRTQIIIGFYIADFVIPSRMLVIEIDGPDHRRAYDERRDSFLRKCRFNVLRIPNSKAGTYELNEILEYPLVKDTAFHSALGAAMAFRGMTIWRQKKESDGQQRLLS